MSDSFHLFPYLPWEIRDAIWKLAVRPARPGAHILRLFCKEDEIFTPSTPGDELERWEFWGIPRIPSVGAPQCVLRNTQFTLEAKTLVPISWTANNPSAYLIDSGLWNACKESREVMQKAFRPHDWLALVQAIDEAENLRRLGKQRGSAFASSSCQQAAKKATASKFLMPLTLSVRDDSTDRYFTTFPCADLIILQMEPKDILSFEWRDLTFQHTLPALGTAKRFQWRAEDPLSGLRYDTEKLFHYAIEIDPSWNDIHRSSKPYGIIFSLIRAARTEEYCKLWVIDYQLKRKHHVPTRDEVGEMEEKAPPVVFYGSDRKYVEVVEGRYPYGCGLGDDPDGCSEWGCYCWECEHGVGHDQEPSQDWYYDGPKPE